MSIAGTERLAQKPHLPEPQSVRKGEMTSLHRLLFASFVVLFVIKNVVPQGQGRNLADPMDMCFADFGSWGKNQLARNHD